MPMALSAANGRRLLRGGGRGHRFPGQLQEQFPLGRIELLAGASGRQALAFLRAGS